VAMCQLPIRGHLHFAARLTREVICESLLCARPQLPGQAGVGGCNASEAPSVHKPTACNQLEPHFAGERLLQRGTQAAAAVAGT
jgi:hypothetical protein